MPEFVIRSESDARCWGRASGSPFPSFEEAFGAILLKFPNAKHIGRGVVWVTPGPHTPVYVIEARHEIEGMDTFPSTDSQLNDLNHTPHEDGYGHIGA